MVSYFEIEVNKRENNMNELRIKILSFLYKQVEQGKIPHIRKGMPEDLEAFVLSVMSEVEALKSAAKMKAASEGAGIEAEKGE